MGAAIALAVTLAACGTNTDDDGLAGPLQSTVTTTEKSDSTDPVTAAHNDADTKFTQKMVSHNEDASPYSARPSLLLKLRA